jgi:hypothetical protein
MQMFRVAALVLPSAAALVGSAGHARAQSDLCGEIYVDSYTPVVTDCGSWGVHRHPDRPVFRDGRWVIEDDGLEFTLTSNVHHQDYDPKDLAMLFFKSSGVQVRFGVAQPLNGSEPTQVYLEEHLGLYVETEYINEWQNFGLPWGE